MRVDPVCLFYFYLIVYVCVCTCYHSAHVEVRELCGEGSFLLPLPGIEHRTSGLHGNCFYPLAISAVLHYNFIGFQVCSITTS